MAPSLKLPVGYDLDAFEQQSKKMADKVGETVKVVARTFTQVNGEMLGVASSTAAGTALAWSQGAARTVLAFGTIAIAGKFAFDAIGAAISLTREKLEEMVKISDKSKDRGVSAQFFQAAVSESEKLKISVEDVEGALKHAFDATKDKSPIDLDKWETGKDKITEVEKTLRILNAELFTPRNQTLQGLVLFRDADSQEQKVVAVLKAMQQLEATGHRLEALDIAGKMFGGGFEEKMRQGRVNADSMLESLEKARVAADGVFSDGMVQSAKEIDDKLKSAQNHLSAEMKPTLDELARIMLDMKSSSAAIADAFAAVLKFVNGIKVGEFLSLLSNPALGGAQILARRALEEAGVLTASGSKPAVGFTVTPDPSRTRGTGPAPTLKKDEDDEGGRDRLDRAADAIEKRTAMLNAEAQAWNQTTEAREQAKIVAELETVAVQANAAAGKENTAVTEEQRDRINEVAAAWGKAKAAIEAAHSPLATFARESANLNLLLNRFAAQTLDNTTNSMANVVAGTEKLKDAIKSLTQSIIHDLAVIAIRASITGPIASWLFPSFFATSPGGGVLPGGLPLGQGGIGARATGGDVAAGDTMLVGEQGPEVVKFNKAGTVIPNSRLGMSLPAAWPTQASRSGGTVSVVQNFDFTNADPGSEARLRAMAGDIQRASVHAAVQAVQQANANNPSYLSV